MDRLNELIAENLKDIRKGKGLSLEQVSSLTTISKSMLSQLERGEVNPTISTVYKLALGLKVPVTAFTADKPQPFFGTGKKEVDPLAGDDGRYRLYPIFSFREGQDFEIFDLEFDEGGMMQANRQMNGTREFITVYSGELTLIFKDHEYVLKAGDAASYNAFDDYVYKNPAPDGVHRQTPCLPSSEHVGSRCAVRRAAYSWRRRNGTRLV